MIKILSFGRAICMYYIPLSKKNSKIFNFSQYMDYQNPVDRKKLIKYHF